MQSSFDQIRNALSSAYPLTLLVSLEEERMERLLERFAAMAKPEPFSLSTWNCVDGFSHDGGDAFTDPMQALAWIAGKHAPRGFYLFKDLESLWNDRKLLRRLRDTAMKVSGTGRYLFVLSGTAELPENIKSLTYVVISLFPDDDEIRSMTKAILSQDRAPTPIIERLILALRGMSLTEAEHLLKRLNTRHRDLNEDFFRDVLDEKEQITRKEGILEFVSPDDSLSDLGGLDQLKLWVKERDSLFRPTSGDSDLPSPKGVLLMGISGCGKSLAVKVIANQWGLPLFRLDMNLVFAGTKGTAEWVFHRALEAIESLAPAVLWIDEIEMGIGGYNEGATGSMTRIFSTFLTWMQEHRARVFVAATANRINLLPAEILRKGRFDQVFFVDLPADEERKEILNIHLRRNGLDPATYDLILLSSATRGWNGAEIEQAAIQARITAHAKGGKVTQNDLLSAFGKIIPLSKTMEEQIKAIRSWARTRALPATTPPKPNL